MLTDLQCLVARIKGRFSSVFIVHLHLVLTDCWRSPPTLVQSQQPHHCLPSPFCSVTHHPALTAQFTTDIVHFWCFTASKRVAFSLIVRNMGQTDRRTTDRCHSYDTIYVALMLTKVSSVYGENIENNERQETTNS